MGTYIIPGNGGGGGVKPLPPAKKILILDTPPSLNFFWQKWKNLPNFDHKWHFLEIFWPSLKDINLFASLSFFCGAHSLDCYLSVCLFFVWGVSYFYKIWYISYRIEFWHRKLDLYCIVLNFDIRNLIFTISYRISIWPICMCLQ